MTGLSVEGRMGGDRLSAVQGSVGQPCRVAGRVCGVPPGLWAGGGDWILCDNSVQGVSLLGRHAMQYVLPYSSIL